MGAPRVGIYGIDLLGNDSAASCGCVYSLDDRIVGGFNQWQFIRLACFGIRRCCLFGQSHVHTLKYVSSDATRVLGAVFCYTVPVCHVLRSGFYWRATSQLLVLVIIANHNAALAMAVCIDA